jgi:molybdopterin-containing oxidoreductase family membrane subunit
MMLNRMTGPYGPFYWALICCNILVPQFLWSERVKANVPLLFLVALVVNVGMWLERFVIVVSSLSHDRLPFGWRTYTPTWVELALTLGSFGWFALLLLVGLKVLPPLPVAELKEQAAHQGAGPPAGEARHAG